MIKKLLMGVLLSIALVVNAFAFEVTLQWDPNDPAPDGYRLYHRLTGNGYDYNAPEIIPSLGVSDIPFDTQVVTVVYANPPMPAPPAPDALTGSYNRSSSEITLSWLQAVNQNDETHYFVVRAFVGADTSGDSNEVDHIVSTVSDTSYWKLYISDTGVGDWTEFNQIVNTGVATPIVTQPLTTVPVGERRTVFFKVVAHTDDVMFSADSIPVGIDIDRRVPTPPANLRVNITIPVP